MSSDDIVDRALDSLDHVATPLPWREPDEVRHIARRRAITRRSVLGAAGLVAAGGVATALWPDSASTPAPRKRLADGLVVNDRSGSAVELVADVRPLTTTANDITPIAEAEQQFAIDLLRAVPAADTNVVLSPSSLATALTMLQLGAGGRTRDEIARVLHTDHLSSEQQALGWAALTRSLADTGVLESANSLWQQRGFPLRSAFMTQLARYFQTGVWQVDFARDMAGAKSAIDDWCGKHTHGKITKLFDQLDPNTVLVLANAEYFKASWKYRFEPKETRDGPFHLADGSTISVPLMHATGHAAFLVTDDYYAAQLPYAGGRFAAQLIAPVRGSLSELITRLAPADFAAIDKASVDPEAELMLPKFTTATYTVLNAPLQKLGMRAAFGNADFSPMTPEGVAVSQVVQRDYLKVDEQGTEAAAVTGVGIVPQSARAPAPTFDKPFLLLVRDTRTGVILFAGQIMDPRS